MTVGQVPFLSIFGMALTLLISAGLPIGILVYGHKNYNLRWSPFVFGALVYYVSAKLLEPYINAALINQIGYSIMNNPLVYAIYVGLLATAVEELLRYASIKTLIKNPRERDAVMFGLGMGGLEALLIGAWPQVSNILNSLLINNGMMQISLDALVDPELTATYSAIAPLWETASPVFLFAGLERALVLAMHISLSVMMFRFIKSRNKSYFAIAFVVHFAVVTSSAYFAQMGGSVISVLITAVLVLALAFAVIKLPLKEDSAAAEQEKAKENDTDAFYELEEKENDDDTLEFFESGEELSEDDGDR